MRAHTTWIVVAALAAGCWGLDEADTGPDAGGDAGADTDADSDADSDAGAPAVADGCEALASIPGSSNWPQGVSAFPGGGALVTGLVQAGAVFGPGEAGETTLSPASGGEIGFLARYAADASLAWVERAVESPSFANGWATATGGGRIYSCGLYSGDAAFGVGDPGEVDVTDGPGSYNPYVVSYSPDGSFDWARRVDASGYSMATHAVALDDGSVVMAMAITGDAVFGAGEPGETAFSCDDWDVFLAKYAADGGLLWVKHTGGDVGGGYVANYAGDLAVAPDGAIVLTGLFHGGDTVFGEGEENETVLHGLPDRDAMFVAWYDPADGTLRRAVSALADADGFVVAYNLAAHPSGDVSVVGYYGGQALFGAGEAHETALTSSDYGDQFLARFDQTGALLWAETIIVGSEASTWYAAPAGESAVVFGQVSDSGVALQDAAGGAVAISGSDGFIGFLGRYDADGSLGAVKGVAGSGGISPGGIEAGDDGALWIAGSAYGGGLECAGVPGASMTGDGMFLMRVSI